MSKDLKDPTLYRVLSFLFVPARSDDEQIAAASRNLNAALAHFAEKTGLPPADPVMYPKSLAWQYRTLWETRWQDLPKNRLSISAFAQTRHSDGILLLAVEEDGLKNYKCWVDNARQLSEEIFGNETNWHKFFAFPGDDVRDGQLRVTGQAWLATAEWESKPAEGWEAYARSQQYKKGSYFLFSWGFLGYRPAADAGCWPSFELHVEVSARDDRNQLLYHDLPLVLIDFLKVSQFVWPRYVQQVAPDISNRENQLAARIATVDEHRVAPALETTEDNVRELSKLLHAYSINLAELSEDVHTIETDCMAVEATLRAAGLSAATTAESSMLLEMRRIQNQLSSDLEYFKLTNQQGERSLQTLQVLVDIERARNEKRLVVIGIVLATLIGLTQLLPDKYPRVPERYGGLVRLLISFVLCSVVIILYYWRQRAAKKDESEAAQ